MLQFMFNDLFRYNKLKIKGHLIFVFYICLVLLQCDHKKEKVKTYDIEYQISSDKKTDISIYFDSSTGAKNVTYNGVLWIKKETLTIDNRESFRSIFISAEATDSSAVLKLKIFVNGELEETNIGTEKKSKISSHLYLD